MTFFSENIQLKSNEINLNYNYQFKFKEAKDHLLAIGFGIKLVSRTQSNHSWIAEPTISVPDNSPHQGDFSSLNFGFRYQWKELGIGLSNSSLFHTDGTIRITQKQGLNFMANYNFKIKESFEIKPSLLLRTHRLGVSYQLNSLFTLKRKYWIGISYRNKRFLGFMAGWDILEKYRIAYALEGNKDQVQHEITIGLRLK